MDGLPNPLWNVRAFGEAGISRPEFLEMWGRQVGKATALEARAVREEIAEIVLKFVQKKFNEWIKDRWMGGGMPMDRASLFEADLIVRQYSEAVHPYFRIRLKVSDDGRELNLESEDAC